MPKHSLKALLAAVVLGLSSAPNTDLRAADQNPVGVVRISDKGNSTPQAMGAPINQYGEACDHCDGDCQQGSSCYCPLCAMLHRDGVTYSPDHGYRRPVVEHIQRIPVEYHRYWPSKWYGEPGSGIATGNNPYPMVYMPTDTTQLGYYYQRVPQWRPNPGMIPPRPWPSQWHRREVCNGCDNRRQGEVMGDPQLAPTQPAPAIAPEAAPVVPPTPPVEPAAPQASAEQPPAVDGVDDESENTGA